MLLFFSSRAYALVWFRAVTLQRKIRDCSQSTRIRYHIRYIVVHWDTEIHDL